MQAYPIAAFKREKSLVYTAAATFAEYLADAASLGAASLLRRRLAEIRLSPDDQLFFAAYPDTLRWVIVVADDSPDTLVVLPVLVHLADCSPRIDVRIAHADAWEGYLAVLMDDPDLLPNLADADLPLLLIFDEDWRYADQWGPHPAAIDPYLDAWLAEHPDFDALAEDDSPDGVAAYRRLLEGLTRVMRLWYNSALNRACAAEVRGLLARLHEEAAADDET
jgi:hypothetical protein